MGLIPRVLWNHSAVPLGGPPPGSDSGTLAQFPTGFVAVVLKRGPRCGPLPGPASSVGKLIFGGPQTVFLRLSRGPRLLAVGQFPRAAGSPLGRDHGEAENVDTSSLVPQACAPMCLECDLAPAGSGNAACCEEPHRGRRVLRADVVKQRRQPQHRAVPGCCSAAPGRLCAATILHSCVTWPAAHARSGKVWCPMY